MRQLYRRLETRTKEHNDAFKKGAIEKSAVAEHAWTNQHPILWDKTIVIDQAGRQTELFLKEVLYMKVNTLCSLYI